MTLRSPTVLLLLSMSACPAEPVDEGTPGEETTETTDTQCIDARAEVDQFLADNRACDVASDCQYADKGCYNGPGTSCVGVGLRADADLDAWASLSADLGVCGEDCGGDECGASIDCVDNL